MKRQLTRAIHDYFFAKSLEKLRPGGVMALITSRYTMDKQTDIIRRHLDEQADPIPDGPSIRVRLLYGMCVASKGQAERGEKEPLGTGGH
jgi:hypothetical protein